MSEEFEALLGRYWDLAYLEGKSGVSQGDKANEVLYALKKLAPPANKPWVGLTEEDRLDIWKKSSSIDGAINATASKLREKNA